MIRGVALFGLIASGPIIMDEAKDIYTMEVMAPKAGPVSYLGRVVASSSQINYKGKRYTLTNQHVCRIAERFVADRAESRYVTNEELVGIAIDISGTPLKIKAISKEHDLCILEPDMSKSSFSLASSVHMGERVTLIGHPRGLPQTVREGRTISREVTYIPWIEARNLEVIMISTLTYPGNSGSPVLNRFGNLVGVLFAGQSGIHTEGLMVPVESVKKFLEDYERRITQ